MFAPETGRWRLCGAPELTHRANAYPPRRHQWHVMSRLVLARLYSAFARISNVGELSVILLTENVPVRPMTFRSLDSRQARSRAQSLPDIARLRCAQCSEGRRSHGRRLTSRVTSMRQ